MKYKTPLSIRIRAGMVKGNNLDREMLDAEIECVIKDMAKKCNKESPCLKNIVNAGKYKRYHLEAWEYITRKINPHRIWG